MFLSESENGRYLCHPVEIEPETLIHYSLALRLNDPEDALHNLAEAVAASVGWGQVDSATLVVRSAPRPVLGVLGLVDEAAEDWLWAQAQGFSHACSHLRYVSYSQAEQDCEELAARLVVQFGRDDLYHFRFTAIPRGGHFVLGMLAYLLGLEQVQLVPPFPPDTPLVVVDDCALSGARFSRFLESCPGQQVIFAPLYSHPDLRTTIEAQEPQVVACLSARNLYDHGTECMGDAYPLWRRIWRARMGDSGYWIGHLDHIGFAWSEPNRPIWIPTFKQTDKGWHILPPEFCIGNRMPRDTERIPIQVQPEAKGPLEPSEDVVFGELDGQVVVGKLSTMESFGLAGVAADMWRALVKHGNEEDVIVSLLHEYAVAEARLRADLRTLLNKLFARGLLTRGDGFEH